MDIGMCTEAIELSNLAIFLTHIKPRCHDQIILQPKYQIVKL